MSLFPKIRKEENKEYIKVSNSCARHKGTQRKWRYSSTHSYLQQQMEVNDQFQYPGCFTPGNQWIGDRSVSSGERRKLRSYGIRRPYPPAHSLITIPTTQSGLQTQKRTPVININFEGGRQKSEEGNKNLTENKLCRNISSHVVSCCCISMESV